MDDPEFLLHLGNGVYLDVHGALHHAPLPGAAVYEAPASLPIDPKKVTTALEDTAEALTGIADGKGAKEVVEVLADLGLDDLGEGMLEILAGVGTIAGKLVPVLSVVSFAADLAKVLGLFSGGPSEFEVKVGRRFDLLEDQVEAIAAQITQHHLAENRHKIELLLNATASYVKGLNDDLATPESLEYDRHELVTAHTMYVTGVAGLLDESSWNSGFRRDEHTLWHQQSHWIHVHPAGLGQPASRPIMPSDRALAFDGRLMVPVASYAALSYLTAVRAIVPAQRTTGDFAEQLADNFAPKLERLAQLMREQVLARTIHTPDDFRSSISSYNVVKGRIDWFARPWAVGALDLRYHDDLFFRPLWAEFSRALAARQIPASTQRGLLDLHWSPPAVLEPSGPYHFVIVNPEECAEAANEKSERDYATLLATSGHVELLRVAALLRHESTEPSISQTVAIGDNSRSARTGTPTSVTVSSTIPLTHAVISSEAIRTKQEFSARARVRTQPLTRARHQARYRVSLRTLTATTGTDADGDSTYATYQSARYVPSPHDSRRTQLELATITSNLLDEAQIDLGEEWVQSPVQDTIRRDDEVTLTAMTFDTWVPKLFIDPGTEADAVEFPSLTGLGWIGGPRDPGGRGSGGGPNRGDRTPGWHDPYGAFLHGDDGFVLPHAWREYSTSPEAQFRDLRRAEVRLRYRLHWHRDRLEVEVESRPEDRNVVVFLAVEELLPRSRQVLHTVTPLEMHNWVTVVPWDFLDRERDAWAQVGPAIAALVPVLITPEGPVHEPPPIEWISAGDPLVRTGISERLASLERDDPALVARVVADLVP